MISPPRISLARLPTPVQLLERLSDETGTRIWLKRDDLTDLVASGNKTRKLEYSIGQALEEKADVLVTWGGVQSNHCRATAAMAARLGLKSHLLLRGQEPDDYDGNLMLDHLLGAEVSFLPLDEYRAMDETYDRIATNYADKGLKTYAIPVGASDEVGLWGYINCAEELARDCAEHEIEVDAIVSATGSGGTLGGLIIGNAISQVAKSVHGINVCDDEEFFLNKIGIDFNAWSARYQSELDINQLSINVIDGYVGPGYGRATQDVFETIRKLAELEGIILDPVYTGKAFDGMLREIRSGRFEGMKDIIFVHTGGLFGLFPQRQELF